MIRVRGYFTVFMTLLMTVLLSLFFAILGGSRYQAMRLETEVAADTAMNSVLAEYHKELFQRYGIFAIDCSYGRPISGVNHTKKHFDWYLTENLSPDSLFGAKYFYKDMLGLSIEKTKVNRVSFLTDENGAVFRRNMAKVMTTEIGLDTLKYLWDCAGNVKEQQLEEQKVSEKIAETNQEVVSTYQELQKNEELAEEVEAPDFLDHILQTGKVGVLANVCGAEAELSNRRIAEGGLIRERMNQGSINVGNGSSADMSEEEKIAERLLCEAYVVTHFGNYLNRGEETVLAYEQEYILAGYDSDVKNLDAIANRICILRSGANLLSLMKSETKKNEAKIAGEVFALLLLSPELSEVFEAGILLGWAYLEGLYDTKMLFAGKKIPLIKEEKELHYSLSGALSGLLDSSGECDRGLSYGEYLGMFLLLSSEEDMTKRCMNLVEANIRQTEGNGAFRLDSCISNFEIQVDTQSSFGYRYSTTKIGDYNHY